MTEAEKIRYERYKLAYAALMLCYPFTLENLEGEIWADIPNYEGFYQESTFGRTKSLRNNKILKPTLTRYGYLVVDLHKNGTHRSHRVHVLVAKIFIQNPSNKPEVNHRFGNKLDCSVAGLEWVTSAENHQHTVEFGLKKSDEDAVLAKLTNEQVRYIREVYIPHDSKFGVRALARQFGVNHKTVSGIIHGKRYNID